MQKLLAFTIYCLSFKPLWSRDVVLGAVQRFPGLENPQFREKGAEF